MCRCDATESQKHSRRADAITWRLIRRRCRSAGSIGAVLLRGKATETAYASSTSAHFKQLVCVCWSSKMLCQQSCAVHLVFRPPLASHLPVFMDIPVERTPGREILRRRIKSIPQKTNKQQHDRSTVDTICKTWEMWCHNACWISKFGNRE